MFVHPHTPLGISGALNYDSILTCVDQTWRISPSLSRWTCRLPSVFSCGPRPHNRRRKPREYPQSRLPKTSTPCQLLILLLEELIRHSTIVWFTTVSTQLADAGFVCCLFFIPIPEIPAFGTGWK